MQDIESHTIVYLRSLLATRAINEPDVAAFLACWVNEETFHGLALERFLAAAGHPIGSRPKPHGHENPAQWLEARGTALVSRLWPDFCAVLAEMLERIQHDESRHFFFYYRQAEIRLRRPVVARVARVLVDRFWGPVGSGVQPRSELRFMAGYLFSDTEGVAAVRKVDETIRRLPGFATVQLLEAWLDRYVKGGRNGHSRD